MEKRTDECKIRKIMDVNITISIITININGLIISAIFSRKQIS